MILVSIFLCLLIGVFCSKVSVYISSFNTSNEKDRLSIVYKVKLKLKLFGLIPVLIVNMSEDRVNVFGIDINYKKFLNNKKIKKRVLKMKNNFKISRIKLLKPDFQQIDLNVCLGTESIVLTGFLVTVISYVLSYVFQKEIRNFDKEKYKYVVVPKYNNQNVILWNLKVVFNVKLFNIIESII